MPVFDSIMRFFSRHWVATNWGPRICHQEGPSCLRRGEHDAARDFGA